MCVRTFPGILFPPPSQKRHHVSLRPLQYAAAKPRPHHTNLLVNTGGFLLSPCPSRPALPCFSVRRLPHTLFFLFYFKFFGPFSHSHPLSAAQGVCTPCRLTSTGSPLTHSTFPVPPAFLGTPSRALLFRYPSTPANYSLTQYI